MEEQPLVARVQMPVLSRRFKLTVATPLAIVSLHGLLLQILSKPARPYALHRSHLSTAHGEGRAWLGHRWSSQFSYPCWSYRRFEASTFFSSSLYEPKTSASM